MNPFEIPPTTSLGPIYLTTADLACAVDFYRSIIGLQLLAHDDQRAWMGVDEPILVLTACVDAQPKPPRTTGLYHFAILTPSRRDLAHTLHHLIEVGYPLQGASDHLVSEALYLADPDGNGIEIYADRPRKSWRVRDDQVEMATVPLDINGLLQARARADEPWQGLPVGTRVGHIHLHVADLAQAEAFYCDALGFDLMARYGPGASFVAAGGYHHHIGINTWIGADAPPPPTNAIGLDRFTIQLPDEDTLHTFHDHLHVTNVPFREEAEGIALCDPANNFMMLTTIQRMKLLSPTAAHQ